MPLISKWDLLVGPMGLNFFSIISRLKHQATPIAHPYFPPVASKTQIRGRRGRGADDCKFTTVCPGRCMCRHIEQPWLQRLLSAKSCSCLVMSHDLVPEEDKPWTTVHRVQRQRLRTRMKAGDTEHGGGGHECCSRTLCVDLSHQGRLQKPT